MPLRLILNLSLLVGALSAEPSTELKPLMAVPEKIVFEADFSKPDHADKANWTRRQGTRWNIVDGLLVGMPSPAEFQCRIREIVQALGPKSGDFGYS
jgi:hypothetical protein